MDIDREEGQARVSAAGRLAPAEAVGLAAVALSTAQAERLSTVLVDFRDVALVRALSTTECYWVGDDLARAGRGLGKVAVVASEDCIQTHRFVFTVARNRGLLIAPFADEGEALRWLRCAN